jgi:hypothetical protein
MDPNDLNLDPAKPWPRPKLRSIGSLPEFLIRDGSLPEVLIRDGSLPEFLSRDGNLPEVLAPSTAAAGAHKASCARAWAAEGAAAEGAAEGAAAPDKVPTPAFTPASTPAFTPAFTELEQLRLAAAEGGGAHHGAGAGSVSSAVAGDLDVSPALPPSNMSTISSTMISSTTTTNNNNNDSNGTAAAAVLSDALPYDEGIEGPVQLLCVPNGRSNHASLADLRAVVEARLGVAAPVQRIVRIGSDGSWSLLTSAPPPPSKMRRILNDDNEEVGEEGEGVLSSLPAMTDATCTLGGLRVRPGDELWIEAAVTADAPSELLRRRESARHRMTITFNALETALAPGAAEPIDAEGAAALLALGVDVDVTRDTEGQLEFVTAVVLSLEFLPNSVIANFSNQLNNITDGNN